MRERNWPKWSALANDSTSVRRGRGLVKVRLVTLSVVFAVVAAEGLLRVVGYKPRLTDKTLYLYNDSMILPYKLRPHYQGLYLGKIVTIDSEGYRIVNPPQCSSLRDEHQKTVLVVGDSLVFGHGVSDGETIASVLQHRLCRANKHYRVKNIGVPGYTAWNEYASIVDYLRAHSTDLILILYVPNDVSFDNDQVGIGKSWLAGMPSTRPFHRLTSTIYQHFYVSYLLMDSAKRLRTSRREVRTQYLDRAAMNYSMQALSRVRDVCSERGISFGVGIYRDVTYYSDPVNQLRYEAMIRDNLEAREIRSFAVTSHTQDLSLREATVFWNDPHPSTSAIQRIVRDIERQIQSLSLGTSATCGLGDGVAD